MFGRVINVEQVHFLIHPWHCTIESKIRQVCIEIRQIENLELDRKDIKIYFGCLTSS